MTFFYMKRKGYINPLKILSLVNFGIRKCVSAFSLARRPKDPGPNDCGLVDWAWFTAVKGVV